MDRKRIHDEVVEILAAKLHNLPALHPDEEFDYENQKLVPDITKEPLDIAEVGMDLEDAFGINFEETMPGEADMETIGKLIDFIAGKVSDREAKAKLAKAEAEE
jgi:acyl carrier protein